MVHGFTEALGLIVTQNRFDIRQVRMRRGVNLEVRQRPAFNQLGCGDPDDQIIPDRTHALGPRGGCQADKGDRLPFWQIHPFIVQLEPDMALVNDHQIGGWYLSPRQSLDRTDLNRLAVVCHLVHPLDDPDVVNPVLPEPFDRLIDQRQGWDAKQNPLALLPCHLDHGCGQNRLATACR